MRPISILSTAFCAWFVANAAPAHELHTAYLELRQTGDETYDVLWELPVRSDLRSGVRVRWPEGSHVAGSPAQHATKDKLTEQFTIVIPGGLERRRITTEGDAAALFETLVRLVRADGSTQVRRFTPSQPDWIIAAKPGWVQIVVQDVRVGIDHILTGVDHLLFVLGLMLIVKDRWMLVKTITSFTIAHSITLAIATLGLATLPIPPLNAAIALSILFLGPEIVRARRGETSLTIQRPWIVAFAFGLLHGFGFASGLAAPGVLSRGELATMLLLFNLGVEIGQLLFVAIILLLERSFRVLEIRWPRWAEWLPAYTVGSLGAYWTIQRVIVMLGGAV